MPLTPADIHNMAFKRAGLGRRGYDGEQVDALLDAVTLDMIQLLEENDVLREQVRRARTAAGESTPPGVDETALSAATAALDRARRANDQAEESARKLHDRLTDARRAAQAEAEADRPGDRGDGDGVLNLARRTGDQQVKGARIEADALLRGAGEESERITEQARSAAQDIAEDSRRRHQDTSAELHRRHAALLREVDELAEFAGTYRTALGQQVRRQNDF